MIVKLNVGGSIFYTSRETLSNIEGSMFNVWLNSDFPLTPEEDGSIFIDRDGTYFGIILNYMRSLTLPLTIPEDVLHLLRVECDFYNLTSLADFIDKLSTNIVEKVEIIKKKQQAKEEMKEMALVRRFSVFSFQKKVNDCLSSGWRIMENTFIAKYTVGEHADDIEKEIFTVMLYKP